MMAKCTVCAALWSKSSIVHLWASVGAHDPWAQATCQEMDAYKAQTSDLLLHCYGYV